MQSTDWHCLMCGESASEVYKKKLYQGKRYLSVVEDRLKPQKEKAQRFLTKLKFHRFCSHACATNYTAWQHWKDDKRNYTNENFYCQFCGKESEGGRIIRQSEHDEHWNLRMCKQCWRRRLMKRLNKNWEILNKERRKFLRREYYRNNREKCLGYKRRYKIRLGKVVDRMGKAWAIHYNYCRDCGTNQKPHRGHGLCRNCYQKRKRGNRLPTSYIQKREGVIIMAKRGYEPAQSGQVQTISVPKTNEPTPTAEAPKVVTPDVTVRGRGSDKPVARPQ